jgi:hypothetical protein
MQSVPAKDRPKLIAVAIAIVVALAFVVRNLIGVQTNAQSRETDPAAAPAALPGAAGNPASAEAKPAADESDNAGEETVEAGAPDRLPVHDPFRPLERVEIPLTPAAAPTQPAVNPAPTPMVRALPPVQAMTSVALTAPAAAERCQSLPGARSQADRCLPPAAAAEASPASPTAPPAPEVRLVGTVRQDPTALAVFRGSEKAVYIRPQELIEKWRVVRIDDGQVSLRRRDARQIVRVGERLPTAP